MSRKRTGELYQSKGKWYARVTVLEQGVPVRRRVDLETNLKPVARAKLDRLLAGESDVAGAETFEQAARRVIGASRIATRLERLSRLERYAFPEIGALPCGKVKASHVRQVLEAVAARGLSRTVVEHMHDDVAAVLEALWRDEVLRENVARRVAPSEIDAPTDDRVRVVLTDLEFERLIAWPGLSLELRTMCLASRMLGGMRTSDLHAWDWSHVDTAGWSSAVVPRPKTKGVTRLEIPDLLVPALFDWWRLCGEPSRGPVFPDHRGRRRGKRSHVRELRRALWAASVRRGDTIETCELQTDTATTRRVDFHGFRRAFSTGLARAGVNNQTAMALAGHRSPQTHARYVRLVETLSTPAAALPAIRPRAGLNEDREKG